MSHLLSMHGRMGRGRYAMVTLAITLVSYAFMFAIALTERNAREAGTLGLVVFVASAVLQVLFAVQRLHDLGKPGWYLWLFLVPFYNIYFSLVLCFTRGSNETNPYGPTTA